MKPPFHRWITVSFGLTVLAGAAVLGARYSNLVGSRDPASHPPDTVAIAPPPAVQPPSIDDGEDQRETHVLSRIFQEQARIEREGPDTATMLSFSNDPTFLQKTMNAMSVAACEQRFLQLKDQREDYSTRNVLRALFASCAVRDQAAALGLLKTFPRSGRRTDLGDLFVQSVAGVAPEATTRWLLDHGDQLPDRDALPKRVALALKQFGNPRAAVESTDGLPPDVAASEDFSETLTHLCIDWSRDDLQGAFTWASALPDADLRKPRVIQGVIYELVEHQPADATAYVEQHFGSIKGMDKIAAEMARVWGYREPQAALQWAFSLSDPAARRQAVGEAAFAGVTGGNGTRSGTAPQMLDWMNALPADESRGSAWGSFAAGWARIDQDAANRWVHNLPAGAERDEALTTYGYDLAYRADVRSHDNPPSEALTLAESIPDPKLSKKQLKFILYRWEQSDHQAAVVWAADHRVQMPAAPMIDDGIIHALVNMWVEGDHSETSNKELQDVLASWVESDPEIASKWAMDHGVRVPTAAGHVH